MVWLLKYGAVGMVDLLHQGFKVVWHEETVLNLFKRGIKRILVIIGVQWC